MPTIENEPTEKAERRDEIAEQTGLTGVTARRYLNYLVESGRIAGEMNYGTGGRPCMQYRLIR